MGRHPRPGQARINAAYPLGELHIGKGYGPALAKQTAGDLLGIPIERFVLLDLNGFQTLIDALGGIELDMPQALDDPPTPPATMARSRSTSMWGRSAWMARAR